MRALGASFRGFRSARILSWLSIMTRRGSVQSARSPLNDCLKAAVNRGQVSQRIRKMGIDLAIPTPSNHLLNSPESSWHDEVFARCFFQPSESDSAISFHRSRLRFTLCLANFCPVCLSRDCLSLLLFLHNFTVRADSIENGRRE